MIAEPVQRIVPVYFGLPTEPYCDQAAREAVEEAALVQLAGATVPPDKTESDYIDRVIRRLAWTRLHLASPAGRATFIERLRHAHGPTITRVIAGKLARSGASAASVAQLGKEIAQEVMLSFLRQLTAYPDEIIDSPMAYLYRIAVNQVAASTRQERYTKYTATLDDALVTPDFEALNPYRSSPEEMFLHDEMRDWIQVILVSLAPAQRELAILFYVHGLKRDELATHFQVPKGVIAERLRAVRNALRRLCGHMRIKQAFGELAADSQRYLHPYLHQAPWLIDYAIGQAARSGWLVPWSQGTLRAALGALIDAYVAFAARSPFVGATERIASFRALLPTLRQPDFDAAWEPVIARLLPLLVAYLILVRHRTVHDTLLTCLTRSEQVAFLGYYAGKTLAQTMEIWGQGRGGAVQANLENVRAAWDDLPKQVDRMLKEAIGA